MPELSDHFVVGRKEAARYFEYKISLALRAILPNKDGKDFSGCVYILAVWFIIIKLLSQIEYNEGKGGKRRKDVCPVLSKKKNESADDMIIDQWFAASR